jgi:hypothetical protein
MEEDVRKVTDFELQDKHRWRTDWQLVWRLTARVMIDFHKNRSSLFRENDHNLLHRRSIRIWSQEFSRRRKLTDFELYPNEILQGRWLRKLSIIIRMHLDLFSQRYSPNYIPFLHTLHDQRLLSWMARRFLQFVDLLLSLSSHWRSQEKLISNSRTRRELVWSLEIQSRRGIQSLLILHPRVYFWSYLLLSINREPLKRWFTSSLFWSDKGRWKTW